MQKFGRGVVKLRVPILIVSVLLLIPSIFGFLSTRINYDILSYLPSDIETMKGQDIMLDEFGKGGFSLVMLDGMDDKDVEKVKEKIEKVDHVCDVLWYDLPNNQTFRQRKFFLMIFTISSIQITPQ